MNFIRWVYDIVCCVIIPIITDPFYSNKKDFFTPKGIISLMNNFLFGRCNSKVFGMKGCLFGKKTVNLISSSIWLSIKNFSEARGFLLVLRYDSGDSITNASAS